MTVIAWDGVSMAADRIGEFFCTRTVRTKIRRIGDTLVGCAGEARASEAVCAWLESGADPEKFPKIAEQDKANLLVAGPRGLYLYENSPFPMRLENSFFAIGSGGEVAMTVMHLGMDARRAVEVACELAVGCGGGVDELKIAAWGCT